MEIEKIDIDFQKMYKQKKSMVVDMADYQNILQRSINYIERKLPGEIELEEVAERAGLSQFHFMRVFSIFTGYTLKGYIRTRRLSESAKELVNSDRFIYELAQKSGFSSTEPYIRAFKKEFKITPQAYRERNQLIDYIPRLQVQICLNKQGGSMVKYQIKEMPSFTVIGKKQKVISKETSSTINQMVLDMRDFTSNYFEESKDIIGICFHDPRFFDKQPEPEDEWDYMIGWIASDNEDAPSGFEKYQVLEQRYAAFTHPGNLFNLGKTYRYICIDWISEVNYQFAPADELNFFTDKYNSDDSENSEYLLYIPILKEDNDL